MLPLVLFALHDLLKGCSLKPGVLVLSLVAVLLCSKLSHAVLYIQSFLFSACLMGVFLIFLICI